MRLINYTLQKNLQNIFIGYSVDLPAQAKMTQFITLPLLIIIAADNLQQR